MMEQRVEKQKKNFILWLFLGGLGGLIFALYLKSQATPPSNSAWKPSMGSVHTTQLVAQKDSAEAEPQIDDLPRIVLDHGLDPVA